MENELKYTRLKKISLHYLTKEGARGEALIQNYVKVKALNLKKIKKIYCIFNYFCNYWGKF